MRARGKRLTVVNVSYPLAPVTADPVGGAEQILSHLDRALSAAGHRSIVIAPEPSSVAGELITIPAVPDELDEAARACAQAAVRARLRQVLASTKVDVVHLHGLDFDAYLPAPGPPVLVTLHLPLDWYPASALKSERPRTWLHPVSRSQAAAPPPGTLLSAPIENGVAIQQSISARRRRFALALGRVCPEKGFEDALDACQRAETPLFIAGAVFPYPEHRHYFRAEIEPRLNRSRRWIGPVKGRQKWRLLAQARCLLVPSKAAETSSLVAMEALAAGTPVIAYRAGALPDVVEHGRTGFIVGDIEGMAEAIRTLSEIDPAVCRARARERFSLERMLAAYLDRYAEVSEP